MAERFAHWNHRLILQTHDVEPFPPEAMFAIHEVYYDKRGNPTSWTSKPVAIVGDTYREAAEAWMRMKSAFDLPVLEVVDNKLVEWEDTA